MLCLLTGDQDLITLKYFTLSPLDQLSDVNFWCTLFIELAKIFLCFFFPPTPLSLTSAKATFLSSPLGETRWGGGMVYLWLTVFSDLILMSFSLSLRDYPTNAQSLCSHLHQSIEEFSGWADLHLLGHTKFTNIQSQRII